MAQERLERRPDGRVRIALKRADNDGTVAVELDPLSVVCRLAKSVPPPRLHTVKYAGVLASASPWRSRIAPRPETMETIDAHKQPAAEGPSPPKRARTYRRWAELLKRTFALDVLECPSGKGRRKLVAMVTDPKSVARYLTSVGEPPSVPARSPSRGPPYWQEHGAPAEGARRRRVGAAGRQG